MTEIVMPDRIARLPRDAKGRPVPYFTPWKDGVSDFKVFDAMKVAECVHTRACWICGEPLDELVAFVIGPLCSVNRISAEPPSHFDCAKYAAQVCPFLAHSNMQRRDSKIHTEDEIVEPPGVFVDRNPGVTLVWVTRDFKPFVYQGGLLFDIGVPITWFWYTEGRLATRSEVEASFASGLAKLRDIVASEDQLKRFNRLIRKAKELWPVNDSLGLPE
jgi:hypothetical protein